ncbi:MAG: CoA transferase [Tissierellia bacterium]|nr:CoA transferase [Tissierellia bacterium]
MRKPLEGVKVIELATFIAAATAGRFLADLGAEVIKIESPKGDPLRYTAPSEGRPLDMYENTTWELENANKTCISLNLKDEKGKEAFFKLLDGADILITNWRVQALERAGLDYDTLKEKYPSLVYAMCTGYGEFGPDKDLPGFDFTAYFARGGYLETLRQKDARPMNVIPGLGDHNVGMNLAAGILAALYQAKTTGRGEKVTTSLFESAIFNMGMMVQAAQYKGIGKTYPIDVREADNPFNTAWLTSDGRYIQTCMPDYNTYYNKFMAAIGREDLVDNENYFPVQNMQAKNLGTEVYDIVTEAMNKKTVLEWKEILTDADIPFSVAQSWEEILEDEQAWANNCFHKMTYDNGNERTLVCLPVNFAEMGKPEYNRGPLIGEHGPEILKSIGYSDEEIEELIDRKVLYVWDDMDNKFK